MEHLKLYEEFSDDLDPTIRDILGLKHKIEFKYGESHFRYFFATIEGPKETEDEADQLFDEMENEIDYEQGNLERYMDEMELEELLIYKEFPKKFAEIGYYFYNPAVGKWNPETGDWEKEKDK